MCKNFKKFICLILSCVFIISAFGILSTGASTVETEDVSLNERIDNIIDNENSIVQSSNGNGEENNKESRSLHKKGDMVPVGDYFIYEYGGVVFYYEEKADGTIKIIGYDDYESVFPKVFTIPNIIDNKDVTEIDEWAFSDSYGYEILIIPDKIEIIGRYAFAYTDFNILFLSSSVKTIAERAFYSFWSRTIYYSSTEKDFLDIEGINDCGFDFSEYSSDTYEFNALPPAVDGDYVYLGRSDGTYELGEYNCLGATPSEITIPSSYNGINITAIASMAFEDSTIEKVTIPNTITSINERAFAYCNNLSVVNINSSLNYLGEDAFYQTPFYNNLEEHTNINEPIYYNDIVIGYKSEIGDAERDFVQIKNGTRLIAAGSCYGKYSSISLPLSIKEINEYAFQGVSSLEYVFYAGSKEEWDKINVGLGNDFLLNSTIIFNSTGPKVYNGFQYVIEGNSVTIVNYVGNATNLNIPKEIEGISVKSINKAFVYNDKIVKVNLPNSLVSISDFSFKGCTSLVEVNIPSSVKILGDAIFDGCINLKSVDLGDGLTSIPYKFFNNCSSLSNISIPSTVTDIVYYSFYGCNNLMNIELPKNLQSIGEQSFAKTAIQEINVPSKVKSIYSNSFGTSLYKYNVDENNPCYVSVDGVLYNKDKTELVSYPSSKEGNNYSVLGTVKNIDNYAFYLPRNLTSLTINEGLETLSSGFIVDSRKIKDITFPSTLRNAEICYHDYDYDLKEQKEAGIYTTAWYNQLNEEIVYLGPVAVGYKGYNCPNTLEFRKGTKVITKGAFSKYYQDDNLWYYNEDGSTYDEVAPGEIDYSFTSVIFNDDLEEIGSYAFEDDYDLENVVINPGLSKVGVRAFANTSWYDNYVQDQIMDKYEGPIYIGDTLVEYYVNYWEAEGGPKTFKVDDGIKYISSSAFGSCDNLEELILSNSVIEIGSDLFSWENSLLKVTLDSNLKIIDEYAFSGTELDSIDLPEGLREIGNRAFTGTNIKTIEIPSTVENLGEINNTTAFFGMGQLQSINVSKNNKKYKSEDGVLYNNDMTLLIAYPPQKTNSEYIMPSSVKLICPNLLSGNNNITSLVVSKNVEKIPSNMCAGCENLKTVVLPTGLKSISNFAFVLTSIDIIDIPFFTDTFGMNCIGNADVRGFANSCAQTYAKANKLKFEEKILGDSDKDNRLTISDTTRIQLYLANISSQTSIDLHSADMDIDGRNSIADATQIQLVLAHVA